MNPEPLTARERATKRALCRCLLVLTGEELTKGSLERALRAGADALKLCPLEPDHDDD